MKSFQNTKNTQLYENITEKWHTFFHIMKNCVNK